MKQSNEAVTKCRYIVLTDIQSSPLPWKENDDIESLVRLLLYSNEIDIEGIIACSSTFLKRGGRPGSLKAVHRTIDAYEQVRPNLLRHALGYPAADQIRKITFAGIDEYGKAPGVGFAAERYNGNPGVRHIIEAVDADDTRPVWVGLWGGANTLAQAIWSIWKSRSNSAFTCFLSRLRIYGISDQDVSSKWLRDMFGDHLFFISSPSAGDFSGARQYFRATWPGISADAHQHGSETGNAGGGFSGARSDMVSKKWLREHITSHGIYGAQYPLPVFIMEGDTPSYLGLIPNGLNVPEHPGYGGWGGRYAFYKPSLSQRAADERHPLWTNASDTVIGTDGASHTSPQATIWRWREAFQHDFAARMDWTAATRYGEANHPPVPVLAHNTTLSVKEGEKVELNAAASFDPDGNALRFHWFYYAEAGGNLSVSLEIHNHHSAIAHFFAPEMPQSLEHLELHIILEVTDSGTPPLTRYKRVIVMVRKEAAHENQV